MIRRALLVLPLVGCNAVLGISAPIPEDAATDAFPDADTDASDGGCALALADNPCAVFPQCGCSLAQTCEVLGASGITACAEYGTTLDYGVCTGVGAGQCAQGTQCIGGVCKPYCSSDADCLGPNRLCLQITDTGFSTGKPIPGLKVCSAGCDLLNPAAVCRAGVQCYVLENEKHKQTPDCVAPAGTGMGPGACAGSKQADCSPGWACVITGPNVGSCSKWCRMAHSSEDCPSTLQCVGNQPVTLIGGIEYGSCN